MQKNYKENYLKSYATRSSISKGRIYRETESSIRALEINFSEEEIKWLDLR